MKHFLIVTGFFILAACKPVPTTPSAIATTDNGSSENAPQSEEERFYSLTTATKDAFFSGSYQEAKTLAEQLQKLQPKYKTNWNYGNAVQNSNLVLGRLAVRDGDIESAKRYLLAAGHSPGSPQMNSFGPNMSLAKDLTEKGEKEAVVAYLTLCRTFWTMDRGKLELWTKEVKDGRIPDFGANLLY